MRLDNRILLNQLTAARASIDTLIMMLMQEAEAELQDVEQPANLHNDNRTELQRKCLHTRKQSLQTFGTGIHWYCIDCGLEFKEETSDDGITTQELTEESEVSPIVQQIREMIAGAKEG